MARVVFKNVYKIFPNDVTAVSDFNLDIKDEEFIIFVGPSGCGKSTSLRMLAGLEDISKGEIYIDDELINEVEPKNRNIAMVFQNYALYPHMTVYDNMAFALKLKHVDKETIKEKVNFAASILGLEEYLDRKPKTLSGGQRQRVALGRAIVRDAKVFLMDEPLSNLDAKLRVETRAEIIKLHKKLKTNIIYVTHDQTEAMTMGDRIVVMNKGVIQQVDTPENIYEKPANLFVASFIGSPQMNFLNCSLRKEGEYAILRFLDNDIAKYNLNEYEKLMDYNKENIILGFRSENIQLSTEEEADLKLNVILVEMLGSDKYIYCTYGDNEITIRCEGNIEVNEGEKVFAKISNKEVHFFNPETERSLYYD